MQTHSVSYGLFDYIAIAPGVPIIKPIFFYFLNSFNLIISKNQTPLLFTCQLQPDAF